MCIPAGRKLAFLILWGLAPKPLGLAALVVFLQSVVSLNRAIVARQIADRHSGSGEQVGQPRRGWTVFWLEGIKD